ncbi:hypothetical protein SO694_00057265 [Aureococcus anophagefferens]|uniref:Uncharacterized protein n=1 Tax=Aureococcus anophagefferens TaxID=44056 RepID=A0ABR1FX58_AURAN
MVKFVPVADPEAPRWEQDEAKLAKHRQFDSMVISRDATERRALGRGRGSTTEKPQTNRGFEQGSVGWGVLGSFGSEQRDGAAQAGARKGEGNLKMVQNDKGLWLVDRVLEVFNSDAPPAARRGALAGCFADAGLAVAPLRLGGRRRAGPAAVDAIVAASSRLGRATPRVRVFMEAGDEAETPPGPGDASLCLDSAASASPSSAQRRSSNPVAPFPLGSSSEDEPPAMVIQDPGDESYEITRAMPTRTRRGASSGARGRAGEGERLKAHADLDPAPLPAAARVEATALPLERALFADGDEDRARTPPPARGAGRVRPNSEDGAPPSSCWSKAGSRKWQEPLRPSPPRPRSVEPAPSRADVPRDEPAPRRLGTARTRGLLRPPLRPRPKGETRARSRSARPRDDLADRLDTAVSELARRARAERDGELAEIRGARGAARREAQRRGRRRRGRRGARGVAAVLRRRPLGLGSGAAAAVARAQDPEATAFPPPRRAASPPAPSPGALAFCYDAQHAPKRPGLAMVFCTGWGEDDDDGDDGDVDDEGVRVVHLEPRPDGAAA